MPIRQNDAYAGIGSRETPPEILELMKQLAQHFTAAGLTLRSGGASGADSAFEFGVDLGKGPKEIFLPWKGFNSNPSLLFNIPDRAFDIAEEHHPAWVRCKEPARKLHARNAQQILGQNLDSPSKFVICWTPDGAEKSTSSKTGGTGQAIRIANAYNVPVFNLYNEGRYGDVLSFIEDKMLQYSDYFD